MSKTFFLPYSSTVGTCTYGTSLIPAADVCQYPIGLLFTQVYLLFDLHYNNFIAQHMSAQIHTTIPTEARYSAEPVLKNLVPFLEQVGGIIGIKSPKRIKKGLL